MRIVHVIASLIGGAAVQMTLLARAQVRAGHDVTVLAPDDCASGHDRLREAGVTWIDAPLDRGLRRRGLSLLRAAIRQGPDVLHCHGQRGALHARLALMGLRRRPRVVYTFHGFHIPHYPGRSRRLGAAALERLLAPWTDRVICLTPSDRQAMGRYLGRGYLAKCAVVPNAVPPLETETASRTELADMAGLPHDGRWIGSVTRLRRQKAVHVLLEAFAQLANQHADVGLVIVGDGPLRSALEAHAASLGIAERVHWLGDRADARRLLPLFEVFVLSSLWEGMSLALLEAMADGIPVVASDVPGNCDLVQHERTGLLVPADDATGLASAVHRLLTHPNEARSLALEAQVACAQRFQVSSMVQATERVYTS